MKIKQPRNSVVKPMTVTIAHLVKTLGTGMYRDIGACTWEIYRNGLCACMLNLEKWEYQYGRIATWFLPSWCGNNVPNMVILDYGRGFSDDDFVRFHRLGPEEGEDDDDDGTRHGGASQKGIGRLAAYALSVFSLHKKTYSKIEGYIVTRRSDGKIFLLDYGVANYKRRGGFATDQIDDGDEEMVPFRHIKGSFSAIVIPNPIFTGSRGMTPAEEVRRAIEWYLPRDLNVMPEILIDGKQAEAPPLASDQMQDSAGKIVYHIAKCKDKEAGGDNSPHSGIWLCDKASGFRIVKVSNVSVLSRYLGRSNVKGDIFIPGLMNYQDTSRQGLSKEFLDSDEWRLIKAQIERSAVKYVKELLGKVADGSADLNKMMPEIINMFHAWTGKPEIKSGIPVPGDGPGSGSGSQTGGNGGGNTTRPRNPNPVPRPPGTKTPSGEKRPKSGAQGPGGWENAGITVEGVTYRFIVTSNDVHIFATADDPTDDAPYIRLNDQFAGHPSTQTDCKLFATMGILLAIGCSKYPLSSEETLCFANRLRKELAMVKSKQDDDT